MSHHRFQSPTLLGAAALLGLCASALMAKPLPRTAAADPASVVGPSSCAECHVEEFEVWQASTHQTASKLLTRNKEAQAIARALGIRRLKNDARCTSCHYTLQEEEGDAHAKAVAGVSCESCHGGAKGWLELHDDFGGADMTAAAETEAHRAERTTLCDENGMVRPARSHAIAETCYACHTITDEELVAAGHPTGIGFELVAWSQGEMRHNFVRGDAGANPEADAVRKRELYVIGQMLELKHALLALAEASGPGPFADDLLARAAGARERLTAIHAATDAMEVGVVLEALAGNELAPGAGLPDVVAMIDECALKLEQMGTVESLAGIDALVPTADSFVGSPAR